VILAIILNDSGGVEWSVLHYHSKAISTGSATLFSGVIGQSCCRFCSYSCVGNRSHICVTFGCLHYAGEQRGRRLLSGRTGLDRLTTPTLLRPFRALIIRPAWDRGAQWSGRKVFREHYRELCWKSFQAREATGLGLARSGQPVIIERRERADCKLARERRPALLCCRLLVTSSQSTLPPQPAPIDPQ
jgi:hypothetical protein